MIIVQGTAKFHPDDMPALRAAAAVMVPATRAEPGCNAYAYAEDMLEQGVVHIIEQWHDDAAIQAHFATPHMAAFNDALGKARVLALKVVAYTATEPKVLMGG